MSPRPNIEKWLEFWMLGNTSLPGNDSLGASLIKPDKWSFLANKPTGFSAGLVATFTITFALNVWGEKYPENIIHQQSHQQQGGDLQTGKSHQGNKCHTQAHTKSIHEEPVSCQHPYTHNHKGQEEGQDLSCCEPATHSKWYLLAGGTGTNEVLTHR